ncbi:MAG: Adenine DNA glycosylase [Chlamydiia bacterium]|nr:Adenine DNA glycosylase [Chlamydiia bacterium]MCH9616328.1 Adenine DNA glycosylase [Chlamydiia bacterium]MCH9629686.1 Adenine DNA glycosylase [Chlamydiia bacterium]
MDTLKHWFFKNRRVLPWRNDPSPYEVWVSEVMLQQTQVSVVVPYFKRWMTLFPSVRALAKAELDAVIKCWEGLGYYSRARNLHAGAKYLLEHHGGEMTEEALDSVKGVGPYTRGAILSFAFKQKAAAVDGNVIRVISRLYNIEEDVGLTSTKKEITAHVEALLNVKEPFVVMEALIELGALVCTKSPKCDLCPLKDTCLGKGKNLPNKRQRVPVTKLQKRVAIVRFAGFTLVQKKDAGVMQGLWEFPLFEEVKMLRLCESLALQPVKHTYTRYHATLFPTVYRAFEKEEVPGYIWMPETSLEKLPFSAGHRRIAALIFL